MIDPISRSITMLQPLRQSRLEIQGAIWYSLQITGIPCKGCVSLTGYLAHGNSIGEAKGSSRHERNRNRVVRNLEEWNVGIKKKNRKQDLTSAKYLTIELPEGCESPNHRLDLLTNLCPNLWPLTAVCFDNGSFVTKLIALRNCCHRVYCQYSSFSVTLHESTLNHIPLM